MEKKSLSEAIIEHFKKQGITITTKSIPEEKLKPAAERYRQALAQDAREEMRRPAPDPTLRLRRIRG